MKRHNIKKENLKEEIRKFQHKVECNRQYFLRIYQKITDISDPLFLNIKKYNIVPNFNGYFCTNMEKIIFQNRVFLNMLGITEKQHGFNIQRRKIKKDRTLKQ